MIWDVQVFSPNGRVDDFVCDTSEMGVLRPGLVTDGELYVFALTDGSFRSYPARNVWRVCVSPHVD